MPFDASVPTRGHRSAMSNVQSFKPRRPLLALVDPITKTFQRKAHMYDMCVLYSSMFLAGTALNDIVSAF